MKPTRRVLLGALAASIIRPARAATTVRIGQATTSLSFLPLWAARALDSFPAQGVALQWATIPGGDPAALAALDSGDLDLAAVGGDTLLAAIGKGQPFVAVASLMVGVTLDLVVSTAFLKKSGLQTSDTVARRLEALRTAVVGVSAVGGAQDRAVRWMAKQGNFDPRAVQVAMVGGPPALQAALENGRIDAFLLSPPEGQIAAAGGYGTRLIGMADDFPSLRDVPFLVLAAKLPAGDAGPIVPTLKALAAADAATLSEPDKAADAIQTRFFPKIDPTIIRAGVRSLLPGITRKGAIGAQDAAAMLRYAAQSGVTVDGVTPESVWTSRFLDAALR